MDSVDDALMLCPSTGMFASVGGEAVFCFAFCSPFAKVRSVIFYNSIGTVHRGCSKLNICQRSKGFRFLKYYKSVIIVLLYSFLKYVL